MASDVKILLVDDNPMVLGMLQQALSTMGSVTVATDAADALLKAVDDLPDVMICDYRMPGMDGRQLLEKLKALDGNALTEKTKHYLDKEEVNAVMARRDKIVAQFQKMIAEKGENEVLY